MTTGIPPQDQQYDSEVLGSGEPNLEKAFLELAERCRRDTRTLSSTDEIAMHQAYQQIIGMGKDAVPFLLRELERSSGRWFWALKSIVKAIPSPILSRSGRLRILVNPT